MKGLHPPQPSRGPADQFNTPDLQFDNLHRGGEGIKSEHLNLSVVSSVVDVTPSMLNHGASPSEN